MSDRQMISTRLPAHLVRAIDERAAELAMTRTAWIEQALIYALSIKGQSYKLVTKAEL